MYIINKFKEQVESNPTKIAVTSKARNYTFKEIKNIAVQIAQELDRKQGSKIVAYYLNDTCCQQYLEFGYLVGYLCP